MKEHLNIVFSRHDYPAEAVEFLLSALDTLYRNTSFVALVERFYKDKLTNSEIIPVLESICADSDLHQDTVKFLYYLCVTKELQEQYRLRGISEDIYWDSIEDFKYKLMEGRAVHGVWGFFQTPWFYPFLNMTQFKLGRLEFTMNNNYWKKEYEVAGIKVVPEMHIIHVHIPSSGEPFTKEACYASYDKAYHFFKDVMKYDGKVFCCGSWLLFPENKEILGGSSNIARFIDDFKIVDVHGYKDPKEDLWRIFGADYDLPYDKLPRTTSLQRAYAEYLSAGNEPAEGIGMFVWDPVNRKPITR